MRSDGDGGVRAPRPTDKRQAHRSAPHKIPRKSQGVYLTFTPLPAPYPRAPSLAPSGQFTLRRRGLVRRADERGLSPPVFPEPGAYLRGTESPLDAEKPPEGGFLRVLRVLAGLAAGVEQLSGARIVCQLEHRGTHQEITKILLHFHYLFLSGKHSFVFPQLIFYSGSIIAQRSKSRKRKRVRNKQSAKNIFRYYHQTVRSNSLSQ